MTEFVILVTAGLANGSLYALVALGLVLIYKAQDMVQFGFGEIFMAGAFIGYSAYSFLGLSYPLFSKKRLCQGKGKRGFGS